MQAIIFKSEIFSSQSKIQGQTAQKEKCSFFWESLIHWFVTACSHHQGDSSLHLRLTSPGDSLPLAWGDTCQAGSLPSRQPLHQKTVPHADHRQAAKLVRLSVRTSFNDAYFNAMATTSNGTFKIRPFVWLCLCSFSVGEDESRCGVHKSMNKSWLMHQILPSFRLKTAGVALRFHPKIHPQHLSRSFGFAGLFGADVEMISSVTWDQIALPYEMCVL